MITHELVQGEAAWQAYRAISRNASDAAAVLGCSRYMTRTELLHAMHTGIRPEPTSEQQHRFDKGHAIEAAKRPVAQEIIGEELYPVVGSADVDGIELSASFDGLTMLEDANWECKSLNDELRAALPHAGIEGIALNDAAKLPKYYRVQMEQQCAVSGAERVLFTASDGQDDDRHCWYYPDLALRAEIVAGWKQFAIDLANYVPPAASAAEKIVAEPVEAFPAPVVQVSGQLTLQDNFKVFEQRLHDFLEHRLIREPKTDQDFMDLDAQIKAMKQAREALGAAEAQMLAQVQPVDRAKKTKDMLDKLLQQNVSMAERLLKDEKERRRDGIVLAGREALSAHVEALNKRIGKPYMPQSAAVAQFAEAVKGLKSLASMEDKVATALAAAKIEANRIADGIQVNLNWLRENAADYAILFKHDTNVIVLKAHDDLVNLALGRINEHKAAEETKEAETRERIRKEEQEKAERKAREKLEAEQQEAAQRAAASAPPQPTAAPAAAPVTYQPLAASQATADGRPVNVVPRGTRRPVAAATPPTLKLGQIAERLGFALHADFLKLLGFEPAAKEKGAVLFHEHQYPQICEALCTHVNAAKAKYAEAA